MLKRFRSRKSNKAGAQVESQSTPQEGVLAETQASPNRESSTGSAFSNSNRRKHPSKTEQRPTPSHSSQSPSPSRCSNTLGLHVIHQPGNVIPLDIIFVHGLGGDSRKTWSKNHDPALFWPEAWLPSDPDVGRARILTFGYNASFLHGAPKSIASISDFAKDLLFEMRFGKTDTGEDLGIGRVPIIFVVHSMGGLVKKACLLSQNDEEYRDVFRSISAIVFLATPHRGTNLAETLNSVLKVSFGCPRNFIADLNKSSSTLEELNEQFRHIAPKLSIWSFYETLATPVGLLKIMVLEKDSSILGYPRELTRPLNADHHEVCKYSSPDDSNYVSVRNALKSLVARFSSKGGNIISDRSIGKAQHMQTLFSSPVDPKDDFNNFRRFWVPGTCAWLLLNQDVLQWMETSPKSLIAWFTAPPASGKSILSTHIVNHLHEIGASCQYFFFRFDDQKKRSVNSLLRSTAFQAAKDIPIFCNSLLELSLEGLRLDEADASLIWRKVFENILFEMDLPHPLYWVIDALDECDSPKTLLDLLRSLPSFKTPVRVFITSWRIESLHLAFERVAASIPITRIDKDGYDHNARDIRILVEQDIKHMRGSEQLKLRVTKSLMERAEGNFLWTRLVLEEILNCHTEQSIQEALEEIPCDMNKMYERMEVSIVSQRRQSIKLLARALLQWIIGAQRSLKLQELSEALTPEFPEFLDLKRTVQDICGQFIRIDAAEHVTMVHQTARDYLIQPRQSDIFIDMKRTQGDLFRRTISALSNPDLRFKLIQGREALQATNPFLFYAATAWPYHLKHSGCTSDDFLDTLLKFLKSQSVLAWIHLLSMAGQLKILVKAAKALTTFVSTSRKFNAMKNPMLHRLSDLEILDRWIVDLVKVVGKFSRHLLADPQAIYKLVPPFCPETSILHRQFHDKTSAEVSINGLPDSTWSDNLAKLTLPHGNQAWKLACAGQHVAVLGSGGAVFLWDSYNFSNVGTLQHGEPITTFCLNMRGNRLATYGLRTTKLWVIPSGQLLSSVTNPADSRAMAIVFADNDSILLTGSGDKVIRVLQTHDFEGGWHELNPVLLKETSQVEGTVVNSPICIAFNGDATQVGVSYRGFPLSVWALKEGQCINRCRRAKEFRHDNIDQSTSWFGVDRFTWNPVTGHVIGLYRDGCIFKWHPTTDENQEVQSSADEIAASPNGKLFVTSNSNGTVRVWNFAYFSVIYQLSSDDLVTALAFSPDCRRFYDLRGASVNAWESNSLIRFSDNEETTSDAASENHTLTSISQASEASLMQVQAISALAASCGHPMYCIGNEDGSVELRNAGSQDSIELTKFYNFLSITHLSWSEDTKYVAAADLGGEIIVKGIEIPERDTSISGTQITSIPSPTLDLQERGIHQLLFSHSSKLLLIVSDDSGYIWSLEEQNLKASTLLQAGSTRRWLNHPTQKHMFLAVGPSDMRIFRWQDFVEQNHPLTFQEAVPSRFGSDLTLYSNDTSTLRLDQVSLNAVEPSKPASSIVRAMSTQDGQHIVVQTRIGSVPGRPITTTTKQLLIFPISSLEALHVDDNQHGHASLDYLHLPQSVAARIDTPLAILPGARLVFLDPDLWVCTYELNSSGTNLGSTPALRYKNIDKSMVLQRHYFIPQDWADSGSLERCCMLQDGTLLYPRDNNVAVIRGGLGEPRLRWFGDI